MKKLREIITKYYDVLAYLFFGALTTLVNYAVYVPCFNLFGWSAAVSNAVAWAVSVAFSFLTNKPFVFKSHDWSAKILWPELTKFVGCRIGSGLLETLIIFIAVDCLRPGDAVWGNVMKLITSVLVVIINYIGSKLLVFRKSK